jgi:FkbM family methyltransferase
MPIFLKYLKEHGHLDNVQMTLCNVGSRKTGQYDDYASQAWEMFAPNLAIYGFDADEDACNAANSDLASRNIHWTEKHIPLALGKAVEERTLHVTKHPMCSSLYPPNEPYLARFSGLPELVNLDFEVEMSTTTLDDFCEAEHLNEIDFLQIDVQGADLDVLKGAKQLLERGGLAIQIEVEFSSLYLEQPLFADVDYHLREQGFTLFNLEALSRARRIRSPITSQRRPGQLLWADAFYFRDLLSESPTTLRSPQRLLKLACIADILDFPDYALEVLEFLTLEYGDDPVYNLAGSIVEGLAQFPELVQNGLSSLPIVQSLQNYLTSVNLSE